MCYPFDAQPPEAPGSDRTAVTSTDLVLTSADGTKFAAMYAKANAPTGAGIVVLPDVRGLFPFYEELARGIAAHGIDAVAIDYFGPTAGVSKRGEEFAFMEHVRQTKQTTVAEDTAAAVAYLRSPEGGSCSSIFTVGFCFGGSNSWNQSGAGHGLAGAIGFYGRPGPGYDGTPGPAVRAKEYKAPILALMGGADQGIPPEQVEELRAALQASGVEHEIVVYPGAPHSFFDRAYKEHTDASADAWKRVLAFIHSHQPQPAGAR
jgi:carboxymethylenebutenolidase